ncbi:MAG TPA: hypothetical protein VLA67_07375, partial [Nitrospiraceae bacterium]|nr:hypothetical protein [Nitrospiraceae bacterium]
MKMGLGGIFRMVLGENRQIILVRLNMTLICLLTSLFLICAAVQQAYAEGPVVEMGQPHASSLQGLASPDPAVQETALKLLVETGDVALLPALTALNDGTLHVWRDAPG